MAPSLALSGVPSSSIRVASMRRCSVASKPTHLGGDRVEDGVDGLAHALADVALVAVAQLDRLERAGRGAARDRRAGERCRRRGRPRPRRSGCRASPESRARRPLRSLPPVSFPSNWRAAPERTGTVRAYLKRQPIVKTTARHGSPTGYSPTAPSIASRSRSAWPLCRAYSSIMCTSNQRSEICALHSPRTRDSCRRDHARPPTSLLWATSVRQAVEACCTIASSGCAPVDVVSGSSVVE